MGRNVDDVHTQTQAYILIRYVVVVVVVVIGGVWYAYSSVDMNKQRRQVCVGALECGRTLDVYSD